MQDAGPLSISLDLSDTKTAIPLIANNSMGRVRLANVSQVPGEKGITTKWEYHLLEPLPSNEGGQINPGFKVFENIQLYSKPDSKNPNWFKEKIARRIDALLGTGDPDNKKNKPARPGFNPETVGMLIGKEAIAKFVIGKTEGGGEFTNIDNLTFPGDVQA